MHEEQRSQPTTAEHAHVQPHPAPLPFSILQEQPRRQTRSASINSNLSPYQTQLQQVLNLKSFGYLSCRPDGNCGFNAVSQLQWTEGQTVNSLFDLPPESQAPQAELRQATACELRSNKVLQTALCQQERHILHTWDALQPARLADAEVPVWELLAAGVLPLEGRLVIQQDFGSLSHALLLLQCFQVTLE